MAVLAEGVDRENARKVILELASAVGNCRVMSAAAGSNQYDRLASEYLQWVERVEEHFRHMFKGDGWLTDLHTERWRQINRIDASTVRPGGLINGEIDHQSARLCALADDLEETSDELPVAITSPEPTTEHVYRLQDLHPKVSDVSAALFRNGHYAEAILQAFIAIEVAVRERSGLDKSGAPLMNQAMGTDAPPLLMSDEAGQTGQDEQSGMHFLFAGAMRGIRNPKAHTLMVQTDSGRAFEYLAFASLLMRRLDDARTSSASDAAT